MALSPVVEAEVDSLIQKLRTKQSNDVNGMSVWLLKRCYRYMLKPLTKLINKSFELGVFPSQLKTAKVIPIFKKGDPCLTSNYRPISILPVLSKVFEKLFFERLVGFLNRYDILSSNQFGFRQKKSTIDAVINLTEDIFGGFEEREHALSVFMDLSKAFDCVNHVTLLHKLEKCGIRGLPLEWLTSYLSDRSQCVQVSNALSQKAVMTQGVPQGSILGPILFLIYVNDIGTSIQNGKIVQYADDTTLCIRKSSMNELEIETFTTLNTCIQHFAELNLQTNYLKTKYINFYLRNRNGIQPTVMVDDTLIEEVDSIRFLGMYLDRGMTWNDHIDHVCSKVASGIYALRNLAQFCSSEVLRTAYFGLVHPHLIYGLSLWGGCAKFKFERVFKLQKKAVRILFKLNYRESCRDAFRKLGLLTLPCQYILEVIMYCRFRCELTQGRNIHDYNTRGRDSYRIQPHRTNAFEQFPTQAGVRLINRLPEGIKESVIPTQFKARLKRLLVSKAFYSVDEFLHRWD